jgi:hypothetical protein
MQKRSQLAAVTALVCRKSLFFSKMPVLYPYKNALLALRPQSQGSKTNRAFILRKGCWRFSWDSAENLNDGADGEQSPPSRLGIVSES